MIFNTYLEILKTSQKHLKFSKKFLFHGTQNNKFQKLTFIELS